MRTSIFILSAMAVMIAIAAMACNSSSSDTKKQTVTLDSAALVKRGDYLVNAMGCDDCHSPKRMGAHGPEIIPELRFSGFRRDGQLPQVDTSVVSKGWTLFSPDFTSAVGVWGASFAGNITSDATGIGNWPEENFIRALRKGKLKGLENGRDLLPPMPWFVYRNLTDEDLKSIFAYLKTTKPVENVVPGPKTLAELK